MNREKHRKSSDQDCVPFLQWCLPRLGMRWQGFRRVRRQVCRRIVKRVGELDFRDLDQYRGYLEQTPGEWPVLECLCRVTISRFYRDRVVFERIEGKILPLLADRIEQAGGGRLSCWSAGCASGEEPFSIKLIWDLVLSTRFPNVELDLLATDMDPDLLDRARAGVYRSSSLRELPARLRDPGFRKSGDQFVLEDRYRRGIALRQQNIRERTPDGPFHLILCRNLVYTYFDDAHQRELSDRFSRLLLPGGFLVLGMHEFLGQNCDHSFEPLDRALYRRC